MVPIPDPSPAPGPPAAGDAGARGAGRLSPVLRRLLPGLLAAAGGVLWGLCFGREGLVVVPWLALAPLILLLGVKGAPLLALIHGLAFWLTSIPWIAPTLETYGGLPPWLSALLLVLLALYLALFQGAFGWLGAGLWRRGGWTPLWALPALWVALEWLRTHLFSGFPWNVAAYAWVEVPGALPVAAWIGAWGVSFLVLCANTGAALAVARRRWPPAALGLLVPLLLLALGGRWGTGEAPPGELVRPVRLLQPNIANLMAWDPEAVAANLEKVLRLSEDACDQPGALLVWPESAAWPYSLEDHPPLRQAVEGLAERGCPVLLNSIHTTPERYYNSAYLVAGSGPPARYDKRHLVPFGEYVPLAGVFGFMKRLARAAGDFSPARELVLLPWEGERLGVAICFEVIFPEEVAETVQQGASLLVTVTNDAWYGDTWAPWQHFRAARFRAAENRRPLLRAAITGVSGLIASNGAVVARLGVGEEGVIRARVAARGDLGPFSRAPWLVPLACTLAAISARLGAQRRLARWILRN